ncbi:MAG: hypothetical protein BECKG1743D_GA0114223_107033 [Candidatus Kentron sp. G]|nr:MAG: hypothetical protein BECKG1743D_GA0114223_107033 [Candidatus Kentron sp. G]
MWDATPEITRAVTPYYEGYDTSGIRIVDRLSSHPGAGAKPRPLDEDHISIVKPPDREAPAYRAARDLPRDYVIVSDKREWSERRKMMLRWIGRRLREGGVQSALRTVGTAPSGELTADS